LAVIDSESFKEKAAVINNWWLYWGNTEEGQRPFQPELEKRERIANIFPAMCFFNVEDSLCNQSRGCETCR